MPFRLRFVTGWTGPIRDDIGGRRTDPGERPAEMAVYNLMPFNVLVVEDSEFMRTLLRRIVRGLGIGRVHVFEEGGGAITHLKELAESPGATLAGGPDLILSDMFMGPVNGLQLLRWVRLSPESPDRFIPFIMVSGAADGEYVDAARRLGVTEFLAKPYSIGTVTARILAVIDQPRQFVRCQSFFGPDRRRAAAGWRGPERRVLTDDDVNIVYSAATSSGKSKKKADVWYFRLPNLLKDKAGGRGVSGRGELAAHMLDQAEAELRDAEVQYDTVARQYLDSLDAKCRAAVENADQRETLYRQIHALAHELRGQGSTFGFPLLTTLAKSLYHYTGPGCRMDHNAATIIKHHADAMRAVVVHNITGDGGEVGNALVRTLEESIEKFAPAAQDRGRAGIDLDMESNAIA